MIAQYTSLVVLPRNVADAIKASGENLSRVMDPVWFLDHFSIHDAAIMFALNRSKKLQYYLGEFSEQLRSGWICANYHDVVTKRILPLADSPSVIKELEEMLFQEAPADSKQIAFEVEDLGEGTVVLVVAPGAIYALRNDNYLMAVLRAIAGAVYQFQPLGKILNDNGTDSLFRRFLGLASMVHTARPPSPVFA